MRLIILVAVLVTIAAASRKKKQDLEEDLISFDGINFKESLPSKASRMWGGVDVTDGQFPHSAYVYTDWTPFSENSGFLNNAVILSDRWVLSTADNIMYFDYQWLDTNQLLVGVSNNASDYGIMWHRVEAIVQQENSTNNGFWYMALLYLETPIEFNADCQPIAMPSEDYVAEGQVVSVAAYKEYGQLEVIEQNVTDSLSCRYAYGSSSFYNSSDQFCLNNTDNIGTTSGDFGAPVFIHNEAGVIELVGIQVDGPGRASTEPSIAWRVWPVLSWIMNAMENPELVSYDVKAGPAGIPTEIHIPFLWSTFKSIRVFPAGGGGYVQLYFPDLKDIGKYAQVMIFDGNQNTASMIRVIEGGQVDEMTVVGMKKGNYLTIMVATPATVEGKDITVHAQMVEKTEIVELQCPNGYTGCHDARKCIIDKYVCDQWYDCFDGLDETTESCSGSGIKTNTWYDASIWQGSKNTLRPNENSLNFITQSARGSGDEIKLVHGTQSDWVTNLTAEFQEDALYVKVCSGAVGARVSYPNDYVGTSNYTRWTFAYWPTYMQILVNGAHHYYYFYEESCYDLVTETTKTGFIMDQDTATQYFYLHKKGWQVPPNITEWDYPENFTESIGFTTVNSPESNKVQAKFDFESMENAIQWVNGKPSGANFLNSTSVWFEDSDPVDNTVSPHIKLTIDGTSEGMYYIEGCMSNWARFRIPNDTFDGNTIEWTVSFADRVITVYLNRYPIITLNPEASCYDVYYGGEIYRGWFDNTGNDMMTVEKYRVITVTGEDDFTLSFWNPDDADDDSSGVVMVTTESNKEQHVLCNDGMGRDEANAICRNQGYKFGMIMDPYDFDNMNEKKDPFHGYEFAATNIECDADSDGSIKYDCTYTDYWEASSPCEEGEVLAVRCAAQKFTIGTYLQVKNKNSGRTRFLCEVDAEKYGAEFEVKEFVSATLLSRSKTGDYTILDSDMDHKRSKFRTKLRTRDIDVQCYVCLATVQNTMIFDVATNDESCDYEMQNLTVYSEILQWMLSGMEGDM